MKKRLFFTSVFLITISYISFAQFTTVNIDGNHLANEYGDHTTGQNYGNHWFMTWDNTNLYIGVQNANITEGAVIYLDTNPIEPINGGTDAEGTLLGFNYDNTDFAQLPFRADLVIYVRASFREYRTADGANAWSAPTIGFGTYADNSIDRREIAIPWAVIGGIPSQFNWFGYLTSSTGFAYHSSPSENPTGNIGTGARYERYYTVDNTADGSAIKPFAHNSFVLNRTTDWVGDVTTDNSLNVWDFTLNTTGRTIYRKTNAGLKNWEIQNNMLIVAGTIDCGNVDYTDPAAEAKTTIYGDLKIMGGTLMMQGNQEPLDVRQNFRLSAGTLSLSTLSGGNMLVGGMWEKTGGTTTHNMREVVLNGSSEQTILDNSGTANFDYLRIDKSAGDAKLLSNLSLNFRLSIENGDLNLNGFNTTLLGTGSFLEEDRANNHLVKDLTATDESSKGGYILAENRTVNVGAGLATLASNEVAGLGVYILAQNALTVDIRRWHYRGGGQSIRKVYRIDGSITGTISLGINYATQEIPSDIIESNGLALYRWTSATAWEERIASVHQASNDVVTEGQSITSFSHWTVAQSNNVALHTNFLNFAGKQINEEQAQFIWQTVTENKVIGFEIQRSKNLHNFQDINFMEAKQNTNSLESYEVSLENTSSYYFRLKQIYENGEYFFSDIIFIEVETPKEEILVYPNPTPKDIYIKGIKSDSLVSLNLYNLRGQNVFEGQGIFLEILPRLQTVFAQLASSLYILEINETPHKILKK